MKKIFLFTSFSSDYIFGGGSILRYILPEVTKTFIVEWNCISRKPIDLKSNLFLGNLRIKLHKFYSYYPIINRFQKKYDSLHIFLWVTLKALMLRKNDRVWVVLENDMVLLAYYLIKFSKGIRVHISVHDDCLSNYPFEELNDEDKIRYILERAESIDVIGENLRKYYFTKFGVNSSVFRRGVDFGKVKQVQYDKKLFKLLFIGSSHSTISWKKLFEWIKNFGPNYKFEVDIYSSHDFLANIGTIPENLVINFKNTMDEEQILTVSGNYDFSIFFWNDFSKNRIRYSVSTKLTTYLRLGIPMLASIDTESEVYNLFENSIAFNIEKTDTQDFNNWLSKTDFNECFKTYISRFFNKTQLNNNLLYLPFFKK